MLVDSFVHIYLERQRRCDRQICWVINDDKYLYRIDKQLSDFTKTEKIIADYILKNPHKIIDMTVNDLADVTNVSTASIVRFKSENDTSRFSRAKDCDISILTEDIATNPHLELIENESVETLKNKMIARATNTMRFVATNIMDAQIDAICDVLKNARTIFYLDLAHRV